MEDSSAVTVRVMQDGDVEGVCSLVTSVFVGSEPLSVWLNLEEPPFKEYFLLPWLKANVLTNLTLVAVDAKGEIIGAVLNEELPLPLPSSQEQNDENAGFKKLEPIFELLGWMEEEWAKSVQGEGKAFHIFMVAVGEGHKGKGISYKLLSAAIDKAINCHMYTHIVAEATGLLSQRAFERLGFSCPLEVEYSTWTTKKGIRPFEGLVAMPTNYNNNTLPNPTHCKMVVKEIAK